jgi:hypothetical protein
MKDEGKFEEVQNYKECCFDGTDSCDYCSDPCLNNVYLDYYDY